MTLQEAKDQIAKKYECVDWSELWLNIQINGAFREQYIISWTSVSNEAAELYARSKWDEACAEQRDRCVAQFINSPDVKVNQYSAREYCSIAPKPEFKP